MAIDFTGILHAVTALAAGTVAVFSAPPLLAWRRKLGIDTLQTVAAVCNQVVAAMEQTQGAQSGPQKKALALSIIDSILTSHGLTVPEPFIDAAIEAAVLALKPPAAPPSGTVVLPSAQPVSTVTVTSSS